MPVAVDVNWNVVTFFLPLVGETVKLATGATHGCGVGVGLAVGDADALDEADADADELGAGVGVGDGVGVGVDAAPTVGVMTMFASASAARVIVWPPKKNDMSGVRSENSPSTRTVMRFGEAVVPGAHAAEQLFETSAGSTVTWESRVSFRTRHMIRFVSWLPLVHGWPERNEVGWNIPSIAPSRAAFSIVIWEYQTRPRSIAPSMRRQRIGATSASSTRA
ncbi:MAG TPA: hypothetical protein VHR55_09440 [Candidatus Limnocylindria bacterium]|nr:hypothetical protein [Candidatus Limnocylindria bacterium]